MSIGTWTVELTWLTFCPYAGSSTKFSVTLFVSFTSLPKMASTSYKYILQIYTTTTAATNTTGSSTGLQNRISGIGWCNFFVQAGCPSYNATNSTVGILRVHERLPPTDVSVMTSGFDHRRTTAYKLKSTRPSSESLRARLRSLWPKRLRW